MTHHVGPDGPVAPRKVQRVVPIHSVLDRGAHDHVGHQLHVVGDHGELQRRAALPVHNVRIGALVQQHARAGVMAVPHSAV